MRKFLLLFCLLCPGAWAAISAPINCAILSGGSSATIVTAAFGTVATTCATAAANTAGNHITVFIAYHVTSGGSITTGCVDHAGNTYTLISGTTVTSGSIQVIDMAYADNIAAASGNFVTCSLSTTPVAATTVLYAEELSGVATSSSLDTSVIFSQSSGTSITKNITTSVAGDIIEVVVAANASRGTSTAGTGFTLGHVAAATCTEYDVVTTATTYAAAMSYTTTQPTLIVAAAFKPATGSPSTHVRHNVGASE
jgi:hypothetical protein